MTMIRKVTKKWTQKDGTKIRICDMTDAHLANTIALLRRLHQAEISAAYSVSSTFDPDSEASFCADQAIDRMEDAESDHLLFDDLQDEVERRRQLSERKDQ